MHVPGNTMARGLRPAPSNGEIPLSPNWVHAAKTPASLSSSKFGQDHEQY
jgi:hypothetical protein